jgi:hypothetical protein
MANRFARKAGNWNATDVWSDTAAGAAGAEFIPTTGDVAYSNNFDVTINVNATCAEVRNDVNGSGATAGKGFILSNGVTLTADVYGGSAAGANTYCVALSSGSATITGSVNGGISVSKSGAGNTGTGTLTITGNANGPATSVATYGVVNASTGTVTVSGTATGGSAATTIVSHGALNSGTGTLTVANAVGGSQGTGRGSGVGNSGAGHVSVTGTATGGTTAPGADNYGSGTMTVATAAASLTVPGAQNTSTGTLTVTTATPATGMPAVTSTDGLVKIAGPLRRRTVAQGGEPAIFPVQCLRWELTGATAADRIIEMLDPDDSSITEYRQATDAVIVDADLLARLQAVATVATTGAQIAALGPVA